MENEEEEYIPFDPPPHRVIVSKPVQASQTCIEMGASYWEQYINGMDATQQEKQWLIRTGRCESGLRNCAFSGYYCGIMQYAPGTFINAGGTNIWNGAQQLQLALNYYRVRGTGAWPVCGKE